MIKRYTILITMVIIIALVSAYPGKQNLDEQKIIGHDNDLKFITVGDPQINLSNGEGIERLRQVVDFANKSDIDFVIFLGDMTDDGKEKSNDIVKDILKDLKKPYYVVAGNHDIYESTKIFESYYGPMEHIENIKGYQLLFIGINGEKDKNGNFGNLKWSFDFSKANKDIPTLVFIHGPVIDVDGCMYCILQKDVTEYGYSIKPELEKFTNLIGVYSGHVHYDSNKTINGIRYVTINGLINIEVMKIPVVRPSNNVGYSIIKGNKSYYEFVQYN